MSEDWAEWVEASCGHVTENACDDCIECSACCSCEKMCVACGAGKDEHDGFGSCCDEKA